MLSKRKLYVQTRDEAQREAVSDFASQRALDVVFCEPLSYEEAFTGQPTGNLHSTATEDSKPGKMCKEKRFGDPSEVVLGNSMHVFNHEAICALQELGYTSFSFIGSFELTKHEWRELCDAIADPGIVPVLPVYGRVPLMESANCVKKTSGQCDKTPGFTEITDRKNINFPVYCECGHLPHCRNIIYNSVPTSLAGLYESDWGGAVYFSFTTEMPAEVRDILRAFCDGENLPNFKFTRGHYNKAVL